jgi:hypothetical protein
MFTEKVPVFAIPFGVWWWFPIPQAIMGGFAFARVHHPTAMKFALPSTCVPTSTTGMGTKKLVLMGILSMSLPPI